MTVDILTKNHPVIQQRNSDVTKMSFAMTTKLTFDNHKIFAEQYFCYNFMVHDSSDEYRNMIFIHYKKQTHKE